jgi:pimeloyl-ACP methyl ester carboxylesterase
VGHSDPVTCSRTAAEENAALEGLAGFPLGRSEEAKYLVASAKIGTHCVATSGDRMAHYSTANVARDMDLLRRAVGDSKLSYAGYSYGTLLGATYAKLFPGKVRALVLDGTLLPTRYFGTDGDPRPFGVRLKQGEGAADTFAQFKAECQKAGAERCSLARLGIRVRLRSRFFNG